MPTPRKKTPAQIVRHTVSRYATPKEASGVLQNLRKGGAARQKQLTRLRSQLRTEVNPTRRARVMDAARAVHPPKKRGKY